MPLRKVLTGLYRVAESRIPLVRIAAEPFSTCVPRLGIYEPEDLPPPPPPSHDLLNVRLRGFDFTVLESYMKYVSKLASSIGIEVTKSWATPATSAHINNYKPRSTLLQSEYDLTTYERNVQLANVTPGMAGILLDVLNTTVPEGVTLTLKTHEPIDEEIRYIPDYELNALKDELREMINPVKKPGQKK